MVLMREGERRLIRRQTPMGGLRKDDVELLSSNNPVSWASVVALL